MTAVEPSVAEVGQAWISGWNLADPEPFANLFDEDGEYYDVSFGVRRRGRALIATHHRRWRRAVPDFVMTLVDLHVGAGFVAMETYCTGTFDGDDLADGVMKATMKPFRGRTAAVLRLSDKNEIVSCHEYYDRALMPGGEDTPFGQDGF